LVAELERAVADENDIHLLSFNVNIAHDAPWAAGTSRWSRTTTRRRKRS